MDCSRSKRVALELADHGKTAGWAWNKHRYWDSHMPDTFTYVHFSEKTVGVQER